MTTKAKEIILDKHVKLLDSPGAVFSSANGESEGATALRNCVKIERLTDPIARRNNPTVSSRETDGDV